jgi:DNA repair protein RadD
MQTLRPYQARDVDLLAEEFRRARRLCYVCPTGGGKTTVAAETALRSVRSGRVVWMLVHREELVTQAAARLSSWGIETAVLRAGDTPSPAAQAHVISIATAARRIRALQHHLLPPKPGFTIVDEAHHAVAETWREAIAFGGGPVLGLTATPERLDGTGLGDLFEKLVVGPTPRELVDAGAIVPAEIWTGPAPDMDNVRTMGGDFSAPEIAEKAAKLVGDVVATWRKHADGLSTIAFAVNVPHSLAIVASFVKAGVTAAHIDGETPRDQRREIIEGFRAGTITVLSNVAVATEGFDVPDMRACILARPTLSLGLYLQMVGRCLRSAPGKSAGIVLDHGYNAARFGDPMMTRLWSLHASRRKRAPQKTIQLRNGGEFFYICEGCLRANPRSEKICMACGKPLRDTRPNVDEDVDLVAYDPAVAEARRQRLMMEGWQKFKHLARIRGWVPKRALAIWKKSHGGRGPDDMGIFTTDAQKQEFSLWLKGKKPEKKTTQKPTDLAPPLLISKQSSLF